MSTQLEGKIIEYHMSSDEFTDEYKEALKTSIMVENFFDSPVPQKVTKKATKRKSTTYYDSDKGSEDEDYSPTKSKYKEDSSDDDFEPASKKNKSSKVSFFLRIRSLVSLTLFMFIWLLASKFTICIIALNFFLKKRKVKKICIYSKCLGIRYILVGPFGNKLFVLKCTRNFQLNFSDHPNMAQSSHV